MAVKAILVLCAQALLIQSAFSQCVSPAAVEATRFGSPYGLAGRGWAYDGLAYDGLAGGYGLGLGLGCGAPAIEITSTSGGGLPVTSGSAVPPVGLSVTSENVYEGILAVGGEVPFVGTVAVDGILPTAGASAVNYGCGNGITAMVSETLVPASVFSPAAAIAPAAAFAAPGIGFGAGWAGKGYGCAI